MSNRIAFILAFPIRTTPSLITMPFGLNVITLLDQAGYKIDVYLSEYQNNMYDGLFSENVHIEFLDQNYLWPKEGKQSYYALTTFFRLKSALKLRNKYSHIFASGMAGIKLGAILKSINEKSKFIYLNDELPGNDSTNIWVRSEKKSALKCDIVVSPDEVRIPPLIEQIPGLNQKTSFVLPNSPLLSELENIPEINWHNKFGIEKDKKLFLVAGGLTSDTMTYELLHSVHKWPENSVLVLKGKHDLKGFKESSQNFLKSNKVVLSSEILSPEELHSLISYCTASICLYQKNVENLVYIGKSSGKLMRSILLGRPSIVSDNHMDFVREFGVGIVINSIDNLPSAIIKIINNESEYVNNCYSYRERFTYEKAWEHFCIESNLTYKAN